MKPLHLCHYALLVTAMVILNQEKIEMDQLMQAEDMILDFCYFFPEIYGSVKQTMNVHLLRHLPRFVRLHGPLFTPSCFGFESMNSHLKKMVHGTRHVTKQVSFAVNIAKSLPSLVEDLTKDQNMDHQLKHYLQSLTGYSDRLQETCTKDVILGKKKTFQPDDRFIDYILSTSEPKPSSISFSDCRLSTGFITAINMKESSAETPIVFCKTTRCLGQLNILLKQMQSCLQWSML